MKKIGLIGGSGCGKSTVAALFKEYGLMHIDCDRIAREVVEVGKPCLRELTEHFGEQILREDGSLNRSCLAGLAFASLEQTQALNRITHKYILAQLEEEISQCDSPYGVIVDAAALAESGYLESCDCVIAVVSRKNKRLCRIMKRDHISFRMAKQRLNAQKKDSFYCAYADFVIKNNGGLPSLRVKTGKIFEQIFHNEHQEE